MVAYIQLCQGVMAAESLVVINTNNAKHLPFNDHLRIVSETFLLMRAFAKVLPSNCRPGDTAMQAGSFSWQIYWQAL